MEIAPASLDSKNSIPLMYSKVISLNWIVYEKYRIRVMCWHGQELHESSGTYNYGVHHRSPWLSSWVDRHPPNVHRNNASGRRVSQLDLPQPAHVCAPGDSFLKSFRWLVLSVLWQLIGSTSAVIETRLIGPLQLSLRVIPRA